MADPTTWLDIPYSREDCEVTPRMIGLLKLALNALHEAGAPRPDVWRGASGIILDWRFRWPLGSVRCDRLWRVSMDVEDDVDDFGAVGSVSFEVYRGSASPIIIEDWNQEKLDHVAHLITMFLRGATMAWVAEQLPDAVGDGMKVSWACNDFAPGPYSCRTQCSSLRWTAWETGGVCKETSCPV
jgi:hypothetical protein